MTDAGARRRPLAALLALLACLLPGPALGRTARLVKEGIKLLNHARYEQAIGKFQEAYQDDKTLTRTLLLSGVCHLNLDRVPEALTFYERFEDEERDIDPEDRAHLITYYNEADTRLRRRAPEGADGQLPLLLGRVAMGRGQLLDAATRYDEYERGRGGALSAQEAAALRAQRLRLAGRLRARVAAAPAEREQLLLVRLLQGLGEWREALERLGALRAGGRQEVGRAELESLRATLVAAERRGAPRELQLLLAYAELLHGDEAAALGRYEAYRKERRKDAADGPFEVELRALAERQAAALAARHRAEEEARQRADAAAKDKAQEEARRRAALLAEPAPRPLAPAPRPLYKKWWLWTAIGGGLALGVGAAVLGTQLGPPASPVPVTGNVYQPTF